MPKIGIMLILGDEYLERKAKDYGLDIRDNIPLHISLYNIEINEKDKQTIKERALKIVNSHLPVNAEVYEISTNDYGAVRFILRSDEIRRLHKRIVLDISHFWDRDAPSVAKKYYDSYTSLERELYNKYGRGNVIENFEPHITIGRSKDAINVKFRKEVTFNKVVIYYDPGIGENKGWVEI